MVMTDDQVIQWFANPRYGNCLAYWILVTMCSVRTSRYCQVVCSVHICHHEWVYIAWFPSAFAYTKINLNLENY